MKKKKLTWINGIMGALLTGTVVGGIPFLCACHPEESEVSDLINENVILSEETQIESHEWLDEEKNCLRVRIQYIEQPKEEYRHKEDYFIFPKAEAAHQVLHVDYADKAVLMGCDFNAHFEDVTFDGKEDLIISLGSSKAGSHCAYIYENGAYRYEKSFEDIPDYRVDAEKKLIYGSNADSATEHTEYTFAYQDGEFVGIFG